MHLFVRCLIYFIKPSTYLTSNQCILIELGYLSTFSCVLVYKTTNSKLENKSKHLGYITLNNENRCRTLNMKIWNVWRSIQIFISRFGSLPLRLRQMVYAQPLCYFVIKYLFPQSTTNLHALVSFVIFLCETFVFLN